MPNPLRTFLRNSFLSIAGSFCKPAPFVHILNGHMVDWHHDNDADGERFARLLARLHEHCDFVNFEEAVRMIRCGERVERCTLAFSFDDGFRDCYTQIAPQLEKYGVNAMFFVNPNYIDAGERGDLPYLKRFTEEVCMSPGKHPMTWNQIRDLQHRGFLIGAHTLDHYCINDGNIAELEHQIGDCRRVIEERVGVPCPDFAFPFGKLSDANPASIDVACRYYDSVFSQSDYVHYYSFAGRVINRRHFEPFWPVSHLHYFLSKGRKHTLIA